MHWTITGYRGLGKSKPLTDNGRQWHWQAQAVNNSKNEDAKKHMNMRVKLEYESTYGSQTWIALKLSTWHLTWTPNWSLWTTEVFGSTGRSSYVRGNFCCVTRFFALLSATD